MIFLPDFASSFILFSIFFKALNLALNSNVNSFQTKFIMGFENEDHSLIMSLFADSVKWSGPDKKLLSHLNLFNKNLTTNNPKKFKAFYDVT